jgi:PAS domain S-box-containing protein
MLSPLAAPEGVLVTAAIRDISLRRAAEAHLALMEERYRNLLEAAPDIVVVLDRAGTVVLLNHQAEYQFGYDRADLIGQPVSTIIPAGFGDRLAVDGPHRAEDALSRHDGAWFELDARRRDGREFPVEVMLRPVGAGERLLVRVAIRDITARRAAELLLQKMAELKRSNEELDQFACIASHDLQEPLRMVAAYTQLLARRYKGRLDADADQFIAFAVDGATRMQQLIRDVLAYSRAGDSGLDIRTISSGDALQRALLGLSSAVAETGAVVSHEPLPMVNADRPAHSAIPEPGRQCDQVSWSVCAADPRLCRR